MKKLFDIKFTITTTILVGTGLAIVSACFKYDFGVASGCTLMLGKGGINAIKNYTFKKGK